MNFLFLGVYGDVQRVKILYNKKDSALIQMAEPHQAYLGKSWRIFYFFYNIWDSTAEKIYFFFNINTPLFYLFL